MSSASVTRVSARLRATSALAWSRRRSNLLHSGNSCSTVNSILFFRGPLVRSISSEVTRSVGSAREPAIATRACAASVSSARAASSGLSRRAIANTSSRVAPGACNATGASAHAGAATRRIASNASVEVTSGAGGDRESWRGISLRLIDEVAAHRPSLALHIGAEIECPFAGHAGLDLEAINPGLIRGQGGDLAGHLGHAARAHLRLPIEQAGDGDVVRHVNRSNRDGGFAFSRRLCLNQLEAIIVGSGEAVSRGKCRGHKE